MSRPKNEDGRPDNVPQTSGSQGAEGCEDSGSEVAAEEAVLNGLGSGLTPEQWDAFLADDDGGSTSPPTKDDPKNASKT